MNRVKKKRRDYMKKRKFFLILIISLIIVGHHTINTNAESASFYEAEYIDGIYMNKYQYSTKTIYYQKARFFRKTNTGEYAYCIEPFAFFNSNETYESTLTPSNLSEEQIDRIKKIAHFGYGYGTHNGYKWYAVTQMMIWQVADTSGDYYFTDSLNGNRINAYQNEMAEINRLITDYDTLPSFNNQNFTIVEGDNLIIEDKNNILNNYQDDNNLEREANKLIIRDLKEGEYDFKLVRDDKNFNTPIIFYQANNSQNLVKTGYLDKKQINFKVKVIQTNINITKIDKDTKSITASGEAKLDGAEYTLYDENLKELEKVTIENNIANISNLNFGKYYLKETKAGLGYTLDNNLYEINITIEEPNIELILENKVIEKEIIISKKFGEENNWQDEANASFDIYNNNHELIKELITDEHGTIKITLPYGEYKIIQKDSYPGYYKVEPIIIKVTDEETEFIDLKDLKIPVPNTHNESLFAKLLRIIFLILIC